MFKEEEADKGVECLAFTTAAGTEKCPFSLEMFCGTLLERCKQNLRVLLSNRINKPVWFKARLLFKYLLCTKVFGS